MTQTVQGGKAVCVAVTEKIANVVALDPVHGVPGQVGVMLVYSRERMTGLSLHGLEVVEEIFSNEAGLSFGDNHERSPLLIRLVLEDCEDRRAMLSPMDCLDRNQLSFR